MALWLNEADVRAALTPAGLIDCMEQALADFSLGRVVQPVRIAIEAAERSFFAAMPALYRAQGVMGAKLVTVFPGNAARGKHTHLAAIALFDPDDGELLAMLDGRYITEARTAAVSAVSARHLARPDAAVLAILGSGVQAASHFETLRAVRPIRETRVWSPTAEHRARFAAEREGVRAAGSAEEAVEGADLVLVATSSVTPAIDSAWVADGAHVIAIGACRPSQREVAPELVARAALVVDSRAAALVESGDVVQTIAEGRISAEHVRAELGEIAGGRAAGRRSAEEVTLFKSLGLAVEDIAAAAVAYRAARERGFGTEFA
jgi:ornithine cyclodeaminase/alanine dehydrogenase-like protein (mu-crystallin family)